MKILPRPRISVFLMAVGLATAALPAEGSSANKPTLYNYVGKRAETGGDSHIMANYSRKFKVVDFGDERPYVPAKVTHRITPDPVMESGKAVPGNVRVVFVVTGDGRVTEPLVLRSTNRKLSQAVLGAVTQCRFAPARLHGVPVATTLGQDFYFTAK
jgi:TonB family protein